MQTVSTAYRRELQKRTLGKADCRIVLGIVDTDAAADAAVTASQQSVFSCTKSMLGSFGAPSKSYACFEPGRLRMDGSARVAPNAQQNILGEGYISQALCDDFGQFFIAPQLNFQFVQSHSVPALTFTFDGVANDWPASVRLEAWQGEKLLLHTMIMPDAAVYTFTQEILRFDRLRLTFVQMRTPHRRARLQQLIFGNGLCFTGRELASVVQKVEVDPLTRRLPCGSLQFSIINRNALTDTGEVWYSPDAPRGVWRFLEQRTPITVHFGQSLTGSVCWGDTAAQDWAHLSLATWGALTQGGITEWISAGQYYMTAQPAVNDLTASFTAQDVFSLLTSPYYKGIYAPDGKSLYDLALAVLEDAALPRLQPDAVPWILWEGLKNIRTHAPLPVLSHRECLQLIAHAARCTLFCRRDGTLCILPAPSQHSGTVLDFSDLCAEPLAAKTAPLAAVTCTVSIYAPQTQPTQLYKAQLAVHGTKNLHVTYTDAANVTVQISGGRVVEQHCYACAADLMIAGEAEVEVTLTGYPLQAAHSVVTVHDTQAQANAVIENVQNALIDTPQLALDVATWVRDYLRQRTTYTLTTRGNPELEPLDILTTQTLYDTACPAHILKSETRFDGGMQGKFTVKRRENFEA